MITIALADDSLLMCNALSALYQQLGFDVLCEAGDGQELLDKIAAAHIKPDIVSLDVRMPVVDGPDTARHLTTFYPNIKIIAVSIFCHEKHIIDMLKNGARGYLTKNAETEEIRHAIETVVSGNIYIHPQIRQTWRLSMDALDPEMNKKNRTRLLNTREYVFLAYCATDLSYKQIAEKMLVEYKTIDTYRAAVAKKLNIQTRGGLAAYAVKYGLAVDVW